MHNLAIELHRKGYKITGSDDEIYDPARSNLNSYGLLPPAMGWFREKINTEIDLIILGMHARMYNPELLEAQKLKLKIVSYPAFIAAESSGKRRIVIAGSHGKTTTTSMILHVLAGEKIEYDYLVGAKIAGFDRMVKITDADLIVMEGDEYLSSPLDRQPKILHYKPHIAVITGISWDHINVFPTFEEYIHQFELFILSLALNGVLIYNQHDPLVVKLIHETARKDLTFLPYGKISLNSDKKIVASNGREYNCSLIGNHNYQNMAAALEVCKLLGVREDSFYTNVGTFEGPNKRLQLRSQNNILNSKVYLDFAHAPSKVKTTVKAVREWYPRHRLYAFFELHTYSSLNPEFLKQYKGALECADEKLVFYDKHTLEMKNMSDLNPDGVKEAFGDDTVLVVNKVEDLEKIVSGMEKANAIFLFMTSGNFMKMDIDHLID